MAACGGRLGQISAHVSSRTTTQRRPNAFGAELRHDLIISGGRVVDPSQGIDGVMDLGVRWGKVSALEPHLPHESAASVFDAAGLVICLLYTSPSPRDRG